MMLKAQTIERNLNRLTRYQLIVKTTQQLTQ